MPRTMSPIGKAALVSREAVKLVAYLDSVNVWTIGIGHTAGAGNPIPVRGMKITYAEAMAIFDRDIKKYEQAVVKGLGEAVCDKLTDNQFDALVSICYNIGVAWFTGEWKKGKATFVKNIIANNIALASRNIMKFSKPAEITSRRKAEQMQFDTPYDVSLPFGRSTDKKPVQAPKAVVPTLAPPITKRPLTGLAGTLGNLATAIVGKAPNVIDAKTMPPGFNGDPVVYEIQAELRRKGYTEVGKLDGWRGKDTDTALSNAIEDNAASVSNKTALFKYAADTVHFVKAIPAKPVSVERAVATTADVQNAAPEIMRPINNILKIGLGSVFAGGLTGAGDYLQQAKDTVDKAQETYTAVKPVLDAVVPVLTFAGNHPGIVYGGLGVLCLSLVAFHTAAAVQMFRTKRVN